MNGKTSSGGYIYNEGPTPISDAERKKWLDNPPPWRRLARAAPISRSAPALDDAALRRGQSYVCSGDDEVLRANMALALRRPLLVSGRPGLGKTTLAYRVAWMLGLGMPLSWEINSMTSLKDGLYSYDAVGHLQAAQRGAAYNIDEFIRLGPLGTALLPSERPRVLLIDELDKATFDLPNDLLHVFEEGSFRIPELIRSGEVANVYPFDAQNQRDRVPIVAGHVQALHHPVVVITTNGERLFSEAFVRRCIPLELKKPDDARLREIVRGLLGKEVAAHADRVIGQYREDMTDALLQALFLGTLGFEPEKLHQILHRSA